ncbi:MAG: hypothetical protein JSR33_04125 [Proteobacteria bacterium]|nr:hypothetical protein [Pseudomonadota bacterium]
MLKAYLKWLPVALILGYNAADGSCSKIFSTKIGESNKQKIMNKIIFSKHWNKILNQVATGDKKWLSVAQNIKVYTNGSKANELNLAVAKAMSKNSQGVLKLVGHHYTLQEVCTVPYPKTDQTSVNQFLKATLDNLSTQSDPKITALATECSNILKNYKTR